jgi:O-antigen/teichoic acid export membrane protein
MTLGLPSALVFHARRAEIAPAQVMGAVLILTLVAGISGTAVGWFLTSHVLTQLAPPLVNIARYLTLFSILGVLSATVMGALQAQHEFAAFNHIRYAQPLLQLVTLTFLAATGHLTPVAGALALLLTGLPGLIWGLLWLWRSYRPRLSGLRRSIPLVLSYAGRASIGELLSGMANQIDKVILIGLLSPALMGLYIVALNLSRLIAVFAAAVAPVLFPKASGRSSADARGITSRAASLTAAVVIPTTIALILIGPIVIRLFYGNGFEAASSAFRILALEAAISSIVQVLSQAFLAVNRPGLASVQYGSGTLVVVPLLFVLAPRWGIEGAATAMLIAAIVRLATTYWCFVGNLKIPAPRVLRGIPNSLKMMRQSMRAGFRT